MRQIGKRILSMLLVFAMAFSLLPAAARAAVGPPEAETTAWFTGKIGELNDSLPAGEAKFPETFSWFALEDTDLYWGAASRQVIGPTGAVSDMIVFLAPGAGADPERSDVPDYGPGGCSLWNASGASAVYIAGGVAGIGSNAFTNLSALKRVVFQDASGLSYIGERAFYNDDNAVFTDEAGGAGAPLDLSGVTELGSYAFYNCSKLTGVTLGGNITAVETTEGSAVERTENKIPDYAFSSTGLTEIRLPAGIREIGEAAFSGCNLGEIALSEGLVSIGDRAFYRSLGAPNRKLEQLTIPSTVSTIGAEAFYNYQALKTVTVSAGTEGGCALQEVQSAAFGTDPYSAYSTTKPVGDYPSVSVGTDFLTPDEKTAGLFENSVNCYLGQVTPMVRNPDQDVEPTCTTRGRLAYTFTFGGLTQDYFQYIDALGHQLANQNLGQELAHFDATCESNGYTYDYCTRESCGYRVIKQYDAPSTQLRHDYRVTGLTNPVIAAGPSTVITYTCANGEKHTEESSRSRRAVLTLQEPLVITTTDALDQDLLDHVAVNSASGISGELVWGDGVDTAPRQEGTYEIPVVFQPNVGGGIFEDASESAGSQLKLRIQVKKAALNFSGTTFQGTDRYTQTGAENPNPVFEVLRIPDGAAEGLTEWKSVIAGSEWSDVQPADTEIGEYQVRVTFTYDPEVYTVAPQAAAGYTLEDHGTGTATLTTEYTVRQRSMKDARAAAITPGRTYSGTPQETVTVSGMPEGTEITFAWTEGGQEKTETHTAGHDAYYSGASITLAGDYEVQVTFRLAGYETETRSVPVRVEKAEVSLPRIVPSARYYQGLVRTGVQVDEASGLYDAEGTYQAVDAGSYTVTLTLKDADNYQWAAPGGSTAGSVSVSGGKAVISWTVTKAPVQKPALYAQHDYTYDGTVQEPVTNPSAEQDWMETPDKHDVQYRYSEAADGTRTLTAEYYTNRTGAILSEEIFTVTQAAAKDAGEYTAEAVLTNSNYFWVGEAETVRSFQLGQWSIAPQLIIEIPEVSAESAEYSGGVYDGGLVTVDQTGDLFADGILKLNADTPYLYYDRLTEGAKNVTPIDAGTYYVFPNFEFDGRNYSIPNYSFPSYYGQFEIRKAPLTVTVPETVRLTYTGREQEIPGVTVDPAGLKGQDDESDYSIAYISRKWDPGLNEGAGGWSEDNTAHPGLPGLAEVGRYRIEPALSAANYQAEIAAYEVIIGEAGQTVRLESDTEGWDGTQKTVAKTLGDEPFAVAGKGFVADVPTGAQITYQSSAPEIASVDEHTGLVTLHRATGETPVTILVTAADSPAGNFGEGTAQYTLTVAKADPVIQADDINVRYTGSAVSEAQYQTASLAPGVNGADQPSGALRYQFYRTENGAETETAAEELEPPAAVGEYWLRIAYDGDGSYNPAHRVVKVTVGSAVLQVASSDYEKAYDGGAHPLSGQISVRGIDGTALTPGEDFAVTFLRSEEKPSEEAWEHAGALDSFRHVADNGTYWYRIQADNYAVEVGSFRIDMKPAQLEIRGIPGQFTKPYDGGRQLAGTLEGLTAAAAGVSGEPIQVDAVSGTYSDENAGRNKDVSLTLDLSGAEDWGDYSCSGAVLTDGSVTLTVQKAGSITQKPITVTGVDAVDRPYDGTCQVSLTGEPVSADILPDDDVKLVLSTPAGTIAAPDVSPAADVAVLNTAVTLAGADAGNYAVRQVVTDAASGKVDVVIRKAQVQLAAKGAVNGTVTKGYTGAAVILEAEITDAVFDRTLSQDDVAFAFSPSDPAVQVGTYTVGIRLKADAEENYGNFEILPGSCRLEITNAALEVTPKEQYKGVYTGGSHPLTDGWTFSSSTGEPVTDPGVSFALQQDGEEENPGESGNWIAAGELRNVSQTGVYWYRVEYASHAVYYGEDPVQIRIFPAELTVSGNLTTEKPYDGTAEAAITDGIVTGQKNGEDIRVTSAAASYADADAGTGKTITAVYEVAFGTGAEPGNYRFAGTASGEGSIRTVTTETTGGVITAAPVTVAISDQTAVYDGTKPEAGSMPGTDWRITSGQTYGDDSLGVSLTVDGADNGDAGRYAIAGDWDNDNYQVTFTGSWDGGSGLAGRAGVFVITPRAAAVSIGDAGGYYGDTPDLTDVVLTYQPTEGEAGLAPGESEIPGIRLGTDAAADSGVSDGGYRIYAQTDRGAEIEVNTPVGIGNYTVRFTGNGAYTVWARPITIAIDDHRSTYGEALAALEHYTAALSDGYSGSSPETVVLDGDDLGISLQLVEPDAEAAGTYDIQGVAAGADAKNYAVTWTGNGGAIPGTDGRYGKYTIGKAIVDAAFTKGDQTANGVAINVQERYDGNPLVLKNAATGEAVSGADLAALDLAYSLSLPGGGSAEQIASIDPADGTVTIYATGTVRVSVTVTPQDGSNYTGERTTWYDLQIIAGGSMQVTVTPASGLVYRGTEQALLTDADCTLENAVLTYSLDGVNWNWSGERYPTATDAGTYTVYYRAEDPTGQYDTYTGQVSVAIGKADLKGAFAYPAYTFVTATDGASYDSAAKNPLSLSGNPGYTGNPADFTYRSGDPAVAMSANGSSTILVLGAPGTHTDITVAVPGDRNYNDGSFSYTLTVSETLSEISYRVTDTEAEYDGQAHTVSVTVDAPASGVQILYRDGSGAYTLPAPPAYSDVKRAGGNPDGAVEGYEIFFRITAPGYREVEESAVLTIRPKTITAAMFEDSIGNYTYSGGRVEPVPVVIDPDSHTLLTAGTDYTVSYGTPNSAVGPYDEAAGTGGSVTVTGRGNYTGSGTDGFEITAVGQNSLSASLDRVYGVYGDPDTNHAAVTVNHGDPDLGGHAVNAGEIAVAVAEGPSDGAEISGQTVTFTEVGAYTLRVTVSGNHAGSFLLRYVLLPASGEDGGLSLTVEGDPAPAVSVYGELVNGAVAVQAGTETLGPDDYHLTYSYQPFSGGGAVEAGTPYDAGTVFGAEPPAAGLYVVTAEAAGGYTGTGAFVFLVLQKSLDDGMIEPMDDQTYTGADLTPVPAVSYAGDGTDNLITEADYSSAYWDNRNAGEAHMAVTAAADSNNFTGTARASFRILQKDLSGFDAEAIPDQLHTGRPVTPPLTVTDPDTGAVLTQGLDYEAEYTDNTDVGTAKVHITGLGNYSGAMEPVTFRIVAAVSSFALTLDRTAWTWGEAGPAAAEVTYTAGGAPSVLTIGTDYVLHIQGQDYTVLADALKALAELAPGTYEIAAEGMAPGYDGLRDVVRIEVSRIRTAVSVTASPASLTGGGEVTLTLRGEHLPDEAGNLPDLLTVAAEHGTALDPGAWDWTQEGAVWTGSFAADNANETYTFTLAFAGDSIHEPAADTAVVVTARSSGGGGGGSATAYTITASAGEGGTISPEGKTAVLRGDSLSFVIRPADGWHVERVLVDGADVGAVTGYTFENVTRDHTISARFAEGAAAADPEDTGVAGWLNTAEHTAYLQGHGAGRFGPDNCMTRAEAAQMFCNLLLEQAAADPVPFRDVPADAWYAEAVGRLSGLGILTGVGDGRYAPERPITRAEFTAIAMRFAKRNAGGENPFSDVFEDDWFHDDVVGSVQYGWIGGYPDGTFRPNQTITRAEAAAVVNRMLGRSADRAYVDSHADSLVRFVDVNVSRWDYYQIVEASNAHEYARAGGVETWKKLR